MKNLIYIFLLFPLFLQGQVFIDNTASCEKQEFQIDGCVIAKAFIGDVGLTFTPDIYNSEDLDIVWELVSFSGDIKNVVVDATTGEVTYDAASGTLTNNGNSSFVLKATDSCGKVFTKEFCFRISDPVTDISLACNADMLENLPDVAAKYTLFAKVDSTAVFQDVAKTIPSLDGDVVSALQDGNGNGDITVRTNNNPPTYRQGTGPNNTDYLEFVQANNESLQYDVPSVPAAGTAFRVFMVVSTTALDESSSIISSTLQANNNTTANGTWQINDDNGWIGFRKNGGGTFSNVTVGNAAGNNDLRTAITRASFTDGQPKLIFLDYDGTTVSLYINGVLEAQGDPNVALRGEHLKLMENRSGAVFIDGNLYEAIYADATLTDEEATQTQAYFLCKFGLDASLISDPGPFAISLDNCYSQISQFRYQVLSNGNELVYDQLNNTYYEIDDVPTPELGLLEEPICAAGGDGNDISTLTQTVTAGNEIAVHTADGVNTPINETVTQLQSLVGLDATTNAVTQFDLFYAKEGGTTDQINLTQLADESPWDNTDESIADQTSTDINYMNGNVGIGTQNPDVVLHIAGGTTDNQSWNTPSPNEMLKAENLVGGAVVSQIKSFGNNGTLQSNFAIAPRLTNTYANGSDEGIFLWDLIGGGFIAPVIKFDFDNGYMTYAPNDGTIYTANEVMFATPTAFTPDTKFTFGAGQMRFTAYGDGAYDAAFTRLAGFDTDGRVIEVTPTDLVKDNETVTGFTVAGDVITYTKEDGNTDAATLSKTTAEIDQTFIANASVDIQDINDNGTVTLTSERTDTGWAFTGISYEYTGTPDRVNISAQVHQAIDNTANVQRPAPVLELQKLVGAAWIVIATSATGYIRDATDHEETSNTIVFTDINVGTNPQYRLVSRQESTNGGVVTVVSGDMNLEAIEKITVITGVTLN